MRKQLVASAGLALLAIPAFIPAHAEQVSNTEVFFGDTHLHTSYSPDAYLMGNRSASPDTAYRYAKGLPVVHPYHRAKIKIGIPLDFLVVADHGEYMGVIPMVFSGDPRVADLEIAKRWKAWSDAGEPQKAFAEGVGHINAAKPDGDLNSESIRGTVWNEIIDAAERHNESGKFTTFIGWEWSSTPDGANLHRVVFQPEGGEIARKYLPFTSFDSAKPEDLWNWLDLTSKAVGARFVAIPHNQNISKWLMFSLAKSDGTKRSMILQNDADPRPHRAPSRPAAYPAQPWQAVRAGFGAKRRTGWA